MAALFQITAGRPSHHPGLRLLKAEEAAAFLEARELAAALETRAEEQARAAEAVYQKRHEEGYQDGLEAGKMEYAEKIMDTVLSSVEYLENLETELVRLVGEVTRKFIGEMDGRERIVRLVRQALTALRGQKKVIIRVSPREEAAVREGLAGLLKRPEGGGGDFMEVLGDPDLAPGSCRLESELGVVEAGLETQLRNLEKALLKRVRNT